MRLPTLVTMLTLIAVALPAQEGLWITHARQHLATHPDSEGLRHLIEAITRLDRGTVHQHSQTLDQIAQDGWRGTHPEIARLIQTEAPALQAATAAAQAEFIAFPPVETIESPIPNFLTTQMLTKLLVAEARRLEAAGQADQAALRAVQAARFADHFCAQKVSVISHLIGIAGLNLSLSALESTLRHPELTEDAARSVGSMLFQLEQGHVGLAAAHRTEARVFLNSLRLLQRDPDSLRDLPDSERAQLRQATRDLPAFEAEHRRFTEAISVNLERPRWEREEMSSEWIHSLTQHPLLREHGPNWEEALTRSDIALAHLRLCLALCALRLGQPELAGQFVDPFSGAPLSVAGDRVYSLGPDQTDQGGRVPYDPTNGTFSAGDIVALR